MAIKLINFVALFALPLCAHSTHANAQLSDETTPTLSLEQAILAAQQYDPWQQGNELKQKALEYRSIAAGTLPDPTVSLGIANLPTDSWNFDQEAMTQFKVGVSQMFPRGDSRRIRQQQLTTAATQFPFLSQDRRATLTRTVTELWLDAYLAQQTITLIEGDRGLFEQVTDIVQANYANTVGKVKQQDVIRAQLELVQLDDRLFAEKQKFEAAIARLREWTINHTSKQTVSSPNTFTTENTMSPVRVTETLPQLKLTAPALITTAVTQPTPTLAARQTLANWLISHPAIMAIDAKQHTAQYSVDLAKQQYQPQWGVNASYAHRDNMPNGGSRADFFSVGVTFDLPLFTEHKQDKEVAASVAESELIKTEKRLLVKRMLSAVEKDAAQLQRLSERKALYKDTLLIQMHDQAEAALTAYTSDNGEFTEVVRARIAELNAKIAALNIDIEMRKAIARINYFLTQSSEQAHTRSVPSLGEH